jgi:hypothetical protein
MSNILDLTVKGSVPINVTRGKSYPGIVFTAPAGIDLTTFGGFTLTLFGYNSDGTNEVFTVGDGLSIIGNVLSWPLPEVTAIAKTYHGSLKSGSIIYGQTVSSKITLVVENDV